MKTYFQLLITFATLLILNSCHKDKESNADLLYRTWEAKSFMSIESVAYPKNESNKILLTFNKSGTYSLKLDINSCGGDFNLEDNNQINIGSTACTEACCDSQFSGKLAAMLSQVGAYSISGKTLKLEVPQWGWIELSLLE